jgi:hypothetical protein
MVEAYTSLNSFKSSKNPGVLAKIPSQSRRELAKPWNAAESSPKSPTTPVKTKNLLSMLRCRANLGFERRKPSRNCSEVKFFRTSRILS